MQEKVYLLDIVDDRGELLYTLKKEFSNAEAYKVAMLLIRLGERVEIYGKREGVYIDTIGELMRD